MSLRLSDFVSPFWFFSSVITSVLKSCFITVLTSVLIIIIPPHFYYLNYLDSVDTLGAFDKYCKVDGIWWNIRPNYFPLVSNTRWSGLNGFDFVPNIMTYPYLWSLFMDGIIHCPIHIGVFYLNGHFLLWAASLLWYFEIMPPLLPPLVMTLYFTWCLRVWGLPPL